ncbi:MAG TPA: hypothetical protein DHW39_00270 [Erysipelotrichaceae bacterium]|nr:hypothetical protein [Erysipelotrichaceae bacterium]
MKNNRIIAAGFALLIMLTTGCQSKNSGSAVLKLIPDKAGVQEVSKSFGKPLAETGKELGLNTEKAKETHPTEFQFEETADFEGMPMTVFLYTVEDKVNSISYKGIIQNDSDKAADLAGKMISKANEMYGTPVTYDEPYKERTFKDKDIKAFIEAKEMKDLFDIWQIDDNTVIKVSLEVYGDTGIVGLLYQIGQGNIKAINP